MNNGTDISTLAPLLHNGAFLIDNSTFESLLTCDRQALYRIVHQRKLRGQNNSLNFGGATHEGLSTRFKAGGFALESLAAQYRAAQEYLVSKPTDDWRNEELLLDVLQKYAMTHAAEDFRVLNMHFDEHVDGIDIPMMEPAVELPFALPLGTIKLNHPLTCGNRLGDKRYEGPFEIVTITEVPVIWTGKIDLVVEHNGELWCLDHKTTSIFGDKYFDQYELSNQMIGYTWAVEQITKRQCSGAGINVLAIRKPTRTGKGVEFGRKWIPYSHHLVDEWKDNTLHILSMFFSNLVDTGYFPMKMMWCQTKFNRMCEYKEVCNMAPNERLPFLYTGLFEQITWSPLHD